MAAAVNQVHTIALSFSRELRFDRDGGEYRAAFYVPEGDPAELRKLASRANRGDLAAAERLRDLAKVRSIGRDQNLRQAVQMAVAEQQPMQADRIADEICRYAELMGWTA